MIIADVQLYYVISVRLPLKCASPNERYVGQRMGRQDYNYEQQLAKYYADPTIYPRVSAAFHGVELHCKCADGGESAAEAINESLKSGTRVRRHVRVFVLQDVEHAQQACPYDVGRHRAKRDLVHDLVHSEGEEVTRQRPGK